MKRGVALDAVVRKGLTVAELPVGKDQVLLIGRNSFRFLDHLPDVLNPCLGGHDEGDLAEHISVSAGRQSQNAWLTVAPVNVLT